MADPATYRNLAERSWAWVQTQVRESDEGLWLPDGPDQSEPGEYAYGMHSGIGGLAHVLSEIRLTRDLTDDEQRLADGIAETLARRVPAQTEYDYFDGLVSTLGVLTALGADGSDRAVTRLRELATPDGWPTSWMGPPRAVPDGRCNDATLGTASVLLGALWAMRYAVPGARRSRRARRRGPAGRAGAGADRAGLALRPLALRPRAAQPDAELVARPGRHRREPRRGRLRPAPARPRRGRAAGGRAPRHVGGHLRRRHADPPRRARARRPRHVHLLLVPRAGRHVPGLRGPRARRRPRGGRPHVVRAGSGPACTRCGSQASRSAATPASGTTTAAAAVRRASRTSSSTSGSGTARTTTSPSP